jgi:hypothetical protein
MHSRRPKRSRLYAPLNLNMSGKAAFSLKNGLGFSKNYSDAGIVAGVFLVTASRSQ